MFSIEPNSLQPAQSSSSDRISDIIGGFFRQSLPSSRIPVREVVMNSYDWMM